MTAPKFFMLAVFALLAATEAGAGEDAATQPAAASPAAMSGATEIQHMPVPSLKPVLLNANAEAKATETPAADAAGTVAETAATPAATASADTSTTGAAPDAVTTNSVPSASAATQNGIAATDTAKTDPAQADPAETDPAKAEAAAAPPPPPAPTLLIDVDLSSQRMTVTENGERKYTWPISSGRAGYRTPTGTFKPQWMSKMWYSRQYDYSPMPHSIFFSGGTAIHATYATGALGRPASHGCVRLAPANAATIFKLVNRHGKQLTRITVHGTPKFREPAVAGRRDSRRYASGARRSPYVQGYYGGYSYYTSPAQSPRAYYTKRQRRVVQRSYYSGY